MWITDDPIADFDRYEAEKEKALKKLPKCTRCDEHIQQDKAVCIDGDYYCDECLDDMRESTGRW